MAERYFPEMEPILKHANIFMFEGIPHDILLTLFSGSPDEEVVDAYYSFTLPYRCVAIEDGGSCIILMDMQEDQISMDTDRAFIELLPFHADSKFFNDNPEVLDQKERILKAFPPHVPHYAITVGSCRISYITKGHVNIVRGRDTDPLTDFIGSKEKNKAYYNARTEHPGSPGEYGMIMDGTVTKSYICSKRNCYDMTKDGSEKDQRDHQSRVLRNIMVAYQEILYMNRPSHFILRTTNTKTVNSKKKQKKLKRSHQRPLYTILRPDEIRERMGIKNFTDGISQGTRRNLTVPFERRRHWRYLSNDKYRYDQYGYPIEPQVIPAGQRRGELYYKRVNVPATWVGTSEKIVGNKRYKVILNR